MKILFVPVHMEEHFRCVPLGVAYMASYLIKHNYKVKIHDPPPFEKFNISGVIKGFKPDIVAISCMTPSFWKACKIAREIKLNFKIPIVFGGVHPTSVPEEVIENDFIDYVVYGEGEKTMLELLEAIDGKKDMKSVDGIIFKDKEKIIKNKPRCLIENLDSLSFPARNLFPKWYFKRWMCIRGLWFKGTNMMASRGCPFNCTYCASKVIFGRRARFRSAKNIMDEIEHLIKDYKMEVISFSDDTFTVNKRLVKDICREIKRRGLKFKWRVQARADCVDDEMLKLLKESGCVQIDVGVESGSEKILKVLNKGITPQQVRDAFKLFKKNGIRSCATFMIGNPKETMEDVRKTIKLAREIKADYTQFFVTTPYPGTPMYNELKARGELKEIAYKNYHHGGRELQSVIKNSIPQEKLIELQGDLNEEFLKGSIKSLLKSRNFLIDTLFLLLQRPDIIIKAFKNFLKTGRETEFYRIIYYSHNIRKL